MSFRNRTHWVHRVLASLVAAMAIAGLGLATPAGAETTGGQRFVITFSGPLSEALAEGRPVVASGVLTSRGYEQFVSQGPGPTPGSFVAEANFVFPEGTLFVSITGTTVTSRDFGPGDCFHLDVSRATLEITGGTGELAGATGEAAAMVRNMTRRTPTDGGCSQEDPSLTSSIHSRGTLSLPGEVAA